MVRKMVDDARKNAPRVARISKIDHSTDWQPSPVSAETIAKATDDVLRKAKSLSAEYMSFMSAPEGQGSSRGAIEILDPHDFHIEYPFAQSQPRDFEKQTLIADSRNFGVFSSAKSWLSRSSLSKRTRITPPDVLTSWPFHFARILFASVGSSESPLSSLVAAARRSPGTKVQVQQRTVKVGGVPAKFQRLLISRAKAPAFQYEILIDNASHLPLTLRVQTQRGSGAPTTLLWSAKWNQSKGQSFPKKDFDIPDPSQAAPRS